MNYIKLKIAYFLVNSCKYKNNYLKMSKDSILGDIKCLIIKF